MKPDTTRRWPLAVGAMLVCLPLLFWMRERGGSSYSDSRPSTETAAGGNLPQPGVQTLPRSGTPSGVASLHSLAASLAAANSSDAARDTLARLREELSGLSPQAASEAIRQLLDSGTDASTRMDFKVGRDGHLDQSPTLRTFLLDELARVDPVAAGRYAEKILATPTAPDEWALALRNYARANPGDGGRDYLREKVTQLLRHEPWQANPSIGYLEAFDAAVYAGGGEVTTALTDLVRRQDNRAVSHAAFLALDRLTLAEPAATLELLQSNPALMQGREVTRANYFARADPRNPAQRALLEGYLLDAARSAQELETFTGLYPNANQMVSPNLLTENATPDGGELARRDRAALAVVGEWLADPRFNRLEPQLRQMKTRLEQFVPATER